MKIFLSILAGAAWGLLCALLNTFICKKLMRGGQKELALMSVLRMAVDVAALAAVFLLRGVLPLEFEYTIVAAAVALSLAGIVGVFRIARGK